MSDIIDVTHIIAVKDLDAAVAYYRDVLEFEVEDRGAEGVQAADASVASGST